jgi:hypothetical protein
VIVLFWGLYLTAGDQIMTLNGRGLFNFEVQRERGNDTEAEGLWEESFQTHRDSKPFGAPSLWSWPRCVTSAQAPWH